MVHLSKYVSMEDGKTAAPEPPATIEVVTSEVGDTVVSTTAKKVSKDSPEYPKAVKWWMYINGYVPSSALEATLKGESNMLHIVLKATTFEEKVS